MSIPVRITVKIDFADGTQHEHEVHSALADRAGLLPPLELSPDAMRQGGYICSGCGREPDE